MIARRHRYIATPLVALLALMIGACSSEDVGTRAAQTSIEAVGAPVPSPGCGNQDSVLAGTTEGTFTSGGIERNYLLGVPPTNDGETPMPLVLDLHGANETITSHDQVTTMTAKGDQVGFVTVSPQGIGRLNTIAVNHDGTDAVFINELLDSLEDGLCLDESRFYVTGYSGGAMMTALLACDESERFAAAAPIAAQPPIPSCQPDRPVPVRAFQGTGDVFGPPFEGGGTFEAATAPMRAFFGDATIDALFREDLQALGDPNAYGADAPGAVDALSAWATRNGCSERFADEQATANVRILRWQGCPASAPVELYAVEGGGHTWPGSEAHVGMSAVLGPTTLEIDATDLLWEFFQQFHL